jgi:hypothetical protein
VKPVAAAVLSASLLLSTPVAAGGVLSSESVAPRAACASSTLSAEDLRARALAESALATAAPIPKHNAFALRNQRILRALAAKGLPTRADCVRIFVMGEQSHGSNADHGQEMVRTMAGRAGLARGADVRIYADDNVADPLPNGAKTLHERIDLMVSWIADIPSYIDDIVKSAQSHAPGDGLPTLVAISRGYSINDGAEEIVNAVIDAHRGSTLWKSARAFLHHPPTDGDYDALFGYVQQRLETELAKPERRRVLDAARASLEDTVRRARAAHVLVFFASGNNFETDDPNPPGSSRDPGAVAGMIVTGASDPRTRELASWSAEGAEIAMPGVGVPVGRRVRKGKFASLVDGSSYSGPDGIGLTALMVKAQVTDLDALERILTSPAIVRHIGGKAANATFEPDEVGAVVAASLLAK